jgi:hypothetical protein
MRSCQLCQTSFEEEEYTCPYCGMEVEYAIDEAGIEILGRRVEEYRVDILNRIKAIGVQYYEPCIFEGDKIVQGKLRKREILTGASLPLATVVWCEELFRRDEQEVVRLNLYVEDVENNEAKIPDVEMANPQINDFWRIGLLLNSNLTIDVYLGSLSGNRTSKNIKLPLKRGRLDV